MIFSVAKADGTLEEFDVQKLRQSLLQSGATAEEVAPIVSEIESIMYEGMQTQEIYKHAFELLQGSEVTVAARYSLRRALFNLGPTGFPFEDFLARLFTYEGYTTKTRVILQGNCAEHELDVAAYTEDHSFVVEAKFHSSPGMKSDLQVALYCYARLLDLQDTKVCNEAICSIKELMIVTNTKFTSAAEKYALCRGITLLSWEYPKGNNLHDRIQKTGLYPITVLQTLSSSQKSALIEKGVVVCADLLQKPELLRHAHINLARTQLVLEEAKKLSVASVGI